MPNRLRKILPLLALVATGVALLASGWLDGLKPDALVANHAQLRNYVAEYPVAAPLLHMAALALLVATAMPGAILLVLAGGMLFGAVGGTLSALLGVCAGALSLFLASRRAFAAGDRPQPALVEKLRSRYMAHPWSYTMFLRLVPVLPFGAVTLALAWLRCPLRLFVVTTVLGSFAMLSLQATIGSNLVELVTREGGWSTRNLLAPGILIPTVALALLALLPLLIERIVNRNRDSR